MILHKVFSQLSDFRDSEPPNAERALADWNAVQYSSYFKDLLNYYPNTFTCIRVAFIAGFYFRDWLAAREKETVGTEELRRMFALSAKDVER